MNPIIEQIAWIGGSAAAAIAIFAAGWNASKSKNGYASSQDLTRLMDKNSGEHNDIHDRISDTRDRVSEVATGVAKIEGHLNIG